MQPDRSINTAVDCGIEELSQREPDGGDGEIHRGLRPKGRIV
jgi:hypothetical protein